MINVNKLFRRLSIRTKLVIAFVLLGVVPVAVVGGYGALFSFALLNETVLDGLREGVQLKAGEVEQFLDVVREDVVFLSRLPTVRALVEEGVGLARVEAVERAFLAFARSRRAYDQVRYLDERGQEVVRVDGDGERRRIVPRELLQDKSQRYYVRAAMAVGPGRVYVSPMDLNEEWGQVESPPKPMVRYAAPLTGRRGEPRGIVIVNLYAARVLSQVVSLGRERGTVFLTDARGLYLADSRRGRAAPAAFAATTGQRLDADFPPEVARQILSGAAGAVVEPGLRGRIVAFAPIGPGPGAPAWIVAHAYSKGEVFSSIRSLQLLVLALAGGVLVVALAAGVAAARHFTRPITSLIRGAAALAAGRFREPIRVETNDELEDLAHQFNHMAGELTRHEEQLLLAREGAERRAREAEALSRIGTEISRPRPLPQILQLVVDQARDLLEADVAVLCVREADGSLGVGAVSPAGAEGWRRPGEALGQAGCAKVASPEAACPVTLGAPPGSQVAVALRTGERAVGNLCVGYRAMRPVGEDERRFLERLANQAAIAVENARLQAGVRELAALEERERIARDLHDGIIQSIYATGLGLEECARLAEEQPGAVAKRLDEAIESLNTVIRDVRNYIVGLDPEELRRRSLGAALDDLARRLALNGLTSAEVSVEEPADRALTDEQAFQLFHICQEALANVVRHARATRVVVGLRRQDGHALLTVEDDGLGFEPGGCAGGRGLGNMAERARRLGGELTVASARGSGTRVTVRVPVGGPA